MIAILGASGYVGRSLAREFAAENDDLFLFCRDPARLADEVWPPHVHLRCIDAFRVEEFDLIVNSVGAGDPAKVAGMGADILAVTQTWDQRVLSSMRKTARYVFLSSGAIYGRCDAPASRSSMVGLPVNELDSMPPYALAKLAAEIRHRHLPQAHIIDLRIFGYADASIDPNGTFFLADLARSVKARSAFVTSPDDMVRDYAGAAELRQVIAAWEHAGAPNTPADLYSRAPIGKHALLDEVARRYGLEIRYSGAITAGPTGAKPFYASEFKIAEEFGYFPTRDAREVVLEMLGKVSAAS
ncbi:NAD(P)-dependent oxidoreductase [Xanthobacteraceae bacterium Astr-EGSB]|uniref:NAD-dependent epimerase/dehydratase family protein n=1 Tax=Astrobacterium formosum TaxID=3069710 RepID=UPI0027AFB6ED|nr:NAD(P)-dependent oxidoreductase [Xanthobacteraceae bacterium Astr-EGSB]